MTHITKSVRILSAIIGAADVGRPCPTNNELADIGGCQSASGAAGLVRALERKGLIAVTRYAYQRQVTITSSGKQTALVGNPGREISDAEFTRRHARRTDAARDRAPKKAIEPKPLLGSETAKMSQADIQARRDRDQARIRARQHRWLDIEQEKYGLPRRRRPIEEMPA